MVGQGTRRTWSDAGDKVATGFRFNVEAKLSVGPTWDIDSVLERDICLPVLALRSLEVLGQIPASTSHLGGVLLCV
jgi:hypothetical protein